MKILKISQEIDEVEDETAYNLLNEDNWDQNNYLFEYNDPKHPYIVDTDTPLQQFELTLNDEFIALEETMEKAIQCASDHYEGYYEPEQRKEVTPYDKIKEIYGYTDSFKPAGYIMEDGSLVNLNRPQLDHREVTMDGSTKSMQEFIADGNIRMSFQDGYATLHLKKEPSYNQYSQIKKLVEECPNGLDIDLSEGLGELNNSQDFYDADNRKELQYRDHPFPEAVIGDIKSFFNNVIPSQFSKFLSNKKQIKTATDIYDMHEYVDEARSNIINDFHEPEREKDSKMFWSVIKLQEIKPIMQQYVRDGFVRNEKGVERIAQKMLKNLARLQAATEITGHTQNDPAEYFEELGHKSPWDGKVAWRDMTDEQQEYSTQFYDYHMETEYGTPISDYGLDPLWKHAQDLMTCTKSEDQLQVIDKMLQVTHMRGDLAALFIEGGTASLDNLFGDMTNLHANNKKNIKTARLETIKGYWINDEGTVFEAAGGHAVEYIRWLEENRPREYEGVKDYMMGYKMKMDDNGYEIEEFDPYEFSEHQLSDHAKDTGWIHLTTYGKGTENALEIGTSRPSPQAKAALMRFIKENQFNKIFANGVESPNPSMILENVRRISNNWYANAKIKA